MQALAFCVIISFCHEDVNVCVFCFRLRNSTSSCHLSMRSPKQMLEDGSDDDDDDDDDLNLY